jgi:hypothetical protein
MLIINLMMGLRRLREGWRHQKRGDIGVIIGGKGEGVQDQIPYQQIYLHSQNSETRRMRANYVRALSQR